MGQNVPWMSKAEFSRALALAEDDNGPSAMLAFNDTTLDGWGLPNFEPVQITLQTMASLIRLQTFPLWDDGSGWRDVDARNAIWAARRKFHIIGKGSDEWVQREHDKITMWKEMEKCLAENTIS